MQCALKLFNLLWADVYIAIWKKPKAFRGNDIQKKQMFTDKIANINHKNQPPKRMEKLFSFSVCSVCMCEIPLRSKTSTNRIEIFFLLYPFACDSFILNIFPFYITIVGIAFCLDRRKWWEFLCDKRKFPFLKLFLFFLFLHVSSN